MTQDKTKLYLDILDTNQLQSALADTTDFSCWLPPHLPFQPSLLIYFFPFLSSSTPYCCTNEDVFHKGVFMSAMCTCLFKIAQTPTKLIHFIKSHQRYHNRSIWCLFTAMYCITLGRKSVALITYSWSYYYESNLRRRTINECRVTLQTT